MNYGPYLKSLRERAGLTLTAVSKIINVSDSLYSRYEKEIQTIPIKHLITLCNYYNVALDNAFNLTLAPKKIQCTGIDLKLTGSRLKEFRKENNLTQVDIANFLHIDQPTWSIYENGKSLIGTPFLYTICKTYNVSADYLIGRSNNAKL